MACMKMWYVCSTMMLLLFWINFSLLQNQWRGGKIHMKKKKDSKNTE